MITTVAIRWLAPSKPWWLAALPLPVTLLVLSATERRWMLTALFAWQTLWPIVYAWRERMDQFWRRRRPGQHPPAA
jgi:hypothetical protein